jgi:hypothetical protein
MTAVPDQRHQGRWRTATVWPTGRPGPHDAGPGLSAAVAAHAIAVYSRRGDTVCDPDCTSASAITEAIRAGRHAVGIATDPSVWEAVRAGVTAAKVRGAPGDGMILDLLPGGWSGTGPGPGPVALVLTAIRPPSLDWEPGLVGDQLRERLAAYRVLVRSGAHLVALTRPQIVGGSDLASQLAAAGQDAGWRPVQRAVALTAVPPLRVLAATRPPDRIAAFPAHQDVIVFRAERHGPQHPGPPPPFAPATAVSPRAALAERQAAA